MKTIHFNRNELKRLFSNLTFRRKATSFEVKNMNRQGLTKLRTPFRAKDQSFQDKSRVFSTSIFALFSIT